MNPIDIILGRTIYLVDHPNVELTSAMSGNHARIAYSVGPLHAFTDNEDIHCGIFRGRAILGGKYQLRHKVA